jgi:hypothetical protein
MFAIPSSFLESVGADGFKHQPTKRMRKSAAWKKIEQK